MAVTLWQKSGNLIKKETELIACDHCPCKPGGGSCFLDINLMPSFNPSCIEYIVYNNEKQSPDYTARFSVSCDIRTSVTVGFYIRGDYCQWVEGPVFAAAVFINGSTGESLVSYEGRVDVNGTGNYEITMNAVTTTGINTI